MQAAVSATSIDEAMGYPGKHGVVFAGQSDRTAMVRLPIV